MCACVRACVHAHARACACVRACVHKGHVGLLSGVAKQSFLLCQTSAHRKKSRHHLISRTMNWKSDSSFFFGGIDGGIDDSMNGIDGIEYIIHSSNGSMNGSVCVCVWGGDSYNNHNGSLQDARATWPVGSAWRTSSIVASDCDGALTHTRTGDPGLALLSLEKRARQVCSHAGAA